MGSEKTQGNMAYCGRLPCFLFDDSLTYRTLTDLISAVADRNDLRQVVLAGKAPAHDSSAEASSEARTRVLGGPRALAHTRPRGGGGFFSARALHAGRQKGFCSSVSLERGVAGHRGAVG